VKTAGARRGVGVCAEGSIGRRQVSKKDRISSGFAELGRLIRETSAEACLSLSQLWWASNCTNSPLSRAGIGDVRA